MGEQGAIERSEMQEVGAEHYEHEQHRGPAIAEIVQQHLAE